MRDIPVFTTQYGVASLVLREIPYTQSAYVHFRLSTDPAALLGECRDFCRAVGAENVYATGQGVPETYPLYAQIIEMQILKKDLSGTKANTDPVREDTLERWRRYYNDRMKGVPTAAWMDTNTAKEMLKKGRGYFVHEAGVVIGIGMVQGDMIMAIASLRKGSGRDVVLALSEVTEGDTVRLEVEATNMPAVRLYESMGFLATSRKTAWYKIF